MRVRVRVRVGVRVRVRVRVGVRVGVRVRVRARADRLPREYGAGAALELQPVRRELQQQPTAAHGAPEHLGRVRVSALVGGAPGG